MRYRRLTHREHVAIHIEYVRRTLSDPVAAKLSSLPAVIVAMMACSNHPRALSMGEIAEAAGLSLHAVSRAAATMEADGLLVTARDSTDRRRRLVSLTAAGTAAARHRITAMSDIHRECGVVKKVPRK